MGDEENSAACYYEYDCYFDTVDMMCHFKLDTIVPHNKIQYVNKSCPAR